jgi:hypothetical protein
MVNPEELVICKRRGHNLGPGIRLGWQQCKWCGTWVREVLTIEEREDEPPEEDQDPLGKLDRGR